MDNSKSQQGLDNAQLNVSNSEHNQRLSRFTAWRQAWEQHDNAAFFPTFLVSLLLVLLVVVMYFKGYSQHAYTAVDGLKSPHLMALEASDKLDVSAGATSAKPSIVLPPEPMPRVPTAGQPTLQAIAPVTAVLPSANPPRVVSVMTTPLLLTPSTKPVTTPAAVQSSAAYATTFKQGCDALIGAKAAIQFEPRTNYLNATSKRSLMPLMACFQGHQVTVSGHTDAIGTPERKAEVSQLRANAVKDYLISQGVPAKQLVALGMSDRKPLADNETPEGRTKNRRIEFVIEPLTP
jgi:outer membrane protein OmpA-like peptidoglycan-associated protein